MFRTLYRTPSSIVYSTVAWAALFGERHPVRFLEGDVLFNPHIKIPQAMVILLEGRDVVLKSGRIVFSAEDPQNRRFRAELGLEQRPAEIFVALKLHPRHLDLRAFLDVEHHFAILAGSAFGQLHRGKGKTFFAVMVFDGLGRFAVGRHIERGCPA